MDFLGVEWAAYLLLFGAGTAAGTLNVIAGGGSFLTLPLMIFLGLPATVANGTNRVAILVQNMGAVWGFHRYRVLDWSWLRLAATPALAGAALGTWGAILIGDAAFQRVLALIMVVASVGVLWNPGWPAAKSKGGKLREGRAARGALAAAFFLVGTYGGFVQAGVGFLVLAVTTGGGLDLVRGNALKVLLVLAYTPITLAIFGISGKVDWLAGSALAAGNLTGGLLGVRLTVLRGDAWVRRIVTAAILVFAIKLWLSP